MFLEKADGKVKVRKIERGSQVESAGNVPAGLNTRKRFLLQLSC